VDRIRWLCRLAGWLGVPIVVTEEEPEENGETAPVVVDSLLSGTVRHSKPVFDLSASPAILADVLQHGRDTVVLCGLETDVCIAQSALGLLDRGKRVVVVEDAVASAGTGHEQGLRRMACAGVDSSASRASATNGSEPPSARPRSTRRRNAKLPRASFSRAVEAPPWK
jgi:isochorismate hydrolase